MKKLITLLLLLISFLSNAQAPNWAWAKSGGGFSTDRCKIATDVSGNTYIGGSFRHDTIKFDNIMLLNKGYNDIFIAKYNSIGNLCWAISYGGTGEENFSNIEIDNQGNLYIAGAYTNSFTIGTTTLNCNGLLDGFVAKFDTAGNSYWAKSINGLGSEPVNDVAVDINGNVYITGTFTGNLMVGTYTLSSKGSIDVFYIKYDSSGNLDWSKSFGGASDEISGDLALDKIGNLLITGDFSSNKIIFGNDSIMNNGNFDIFLLKCNNFGNIIWTKSFGGNSTDEPFSFTQDNNSNIILTGTFWSDSIRFGATTITKTGQSDIFISKIDSSGISIWTKKYGGLSYDGGCDIISDSYGNTYLIGYYNSNIMFGLINLTSNGNDDVFIVKNDNNGDVVWVKSFGGANDDEGRAICLDGNNNIYIGGYYISQTLTIGSTTLTNNGNEDIFFTKLNTQVGFIDLKHNIESLIYPNPVVNNATVQLNERINAGTIQIENSLGEVVQEHKNINGQKFTISAENLQPGMYYLKLVENGTLLATGKVIVAK